MTQPAEQNPALLPPVPSSPRWPGVVAWMVILLVAGFVILSHARPEPKERPSAGGVSDFQLVVAAKTTVGMKRLIAILTTRPESQNNPGLNDALLRQMDALQTQMESLARTPDQRLGVAIVVAEIKGSDAALTRLDALASADPPQQLQEDLTAARIIYTRGAAALEPGQREQFLQRQGYFAQVALSFGQSETDPFRQQMLAEGLKVVVVTVLAVVGGISAGLLGLVAFLVAIVLVSLGKLQHGYLPRPAGTVYLEMFAVWLSAYVGLSMGISLLGGARISLMSSLLLAAAVPIALLWGVVRGTPWSEMRQQIGWHQGRGWYVEIPLGLIGYVAGLPVIAAGVLIMLLLIWATGASPSHPIIGESTKSALSILVLYSVASLWAPIIEETMFRGVLFHHLRSRWNWLISATVVALLFAAIHPQGWAGVPALGAIAMVLAALREWRGSLLAPMAAHALHNGVLITLLVLLT